VVGDQDALDFGNLELPGLHWYFAVPSWIGVPLRATARVRPEVDAAACIGCGRCAEVCPTSALTQDHPPKLDKRRCVGCFCCTEVCPRGAITPNETVAGRIVKGIVQRFGVVQW
jgi:MinD superfamily P-loop ATPase